jgi:hypothetical protein
MIYGNLLFSLAYKDYIWYNFARQYIYGKLDPKWKAFGIPIAGHSFTLISLVLIFFNLCMWDKGVYIVEIILKFDWLGLEITMQFWRILLTMFVVIDKGTGESWRYILCCY